MYYNFLRRISSQMYSIEICHVLCIDFRNLPGFLEIILNFIGKCLGYISMHVDSLSLYCCVTCPAFARSSARKVGGRRGVMATRLSAVLSRLSWHDLSRETLIISLYSLHLLPLARHSSSWCKVKWKREGEALLMLASSFSYYSVFRVYFVLFLDLLKSSNLSCSFKTQRRAECHVSLADCLQLLQRSTSDTCSSLHTHTRAHN